MAWDDGNNKDPWRSRGNQGPADLDAIVRDLQRKIRGLFGGGSRQRDPEDRAPGGGMGSNLLVAGLLALIGLWSLTGFYIVDEAERAVVLRFGKYTQITLPGLRWHLPVPIEKVVKINTNEVVAWSYQGSMLTRDENFIVISFQAQYIRTDPEKFLFSIATPEETLEDVAASAMREIIGRHDLANIFSENGGEVSVDIADQVRQLIQATLDNYGAGIEVILLPMEQAQYPEPIQASAQDVVKAREDRERAIAEATTYARRLVPAAEGQAVRQIQDAEGYRSRVIADAEGESRRFSQILREYQNAPEVTRERIYLETLEAILSNSTKILVDTEGGNNLLYLPLDQLVQRTGTDRAEGSGITSLPSTNLDGSAGGSAAAPGGGRR